MDLRQQAQTLLVETKKLEEKTKPAILSLKAQCTKLFNAALKLLDSWSGSYIGYHAELYYRDFERPPLHDRFSPDWGGIHGIPEGWQARTADEVKVRIETIAQAIFEAIDKLTKELVKEGAELQNEITISLAPLHAISGFEQEKKLLDRIEQFQWEKKMGEYIQANMPSAFMTRDSEAMAQGASVPAHLYYEAYAHVCDSRCTAVEEFLKLSERLLRQVQVQAGQTTSAQQDSPNTALDFAKLICRRFHLVAKQLTHRRENRPTLKVDDEYDVQDLLHALLRLHFDDVRPEEWPPSYGGGSSRMDFLLKSEQIVIEAKMTRTGLGAREVTDQLTIDAARYRSHPDCKTLVCLVYDPAGLVKNPRGVERDLAKLSGNGLEVICIITP